MANLTKKLVNAETGEETIVDLTADEIAEIKSIEKANADLMAKELATEEAKKSAISKLAALGLTEDEIAALRG